MNWSIIYYFKIYYHLLSRLTTIQVIGQKSYSLICEKTPLYTYAYLLNIMIKMQTLISKVSGHNTRKNIQ